MISSSTRVKSIPTRQHVPLGGAEALRSLLRAASPSAALPAEPQPFRTAGPELPCLHALLEHPACTPCSHALSARLACLHALLAHPAHPAAPQCPPGVPFVPWC